MPDRDDRGLGQALAQDAVDLRLGGLVEALLAAGAREVTVRAMDYVFRPDNPLAERLFKRLGSG